MVHSNKNESKVTDLDEVTPLLVRHRVAGKHAEQYRPQLFALVRLAAALEYALTELLGLHNASVRVKKVAVLMVAQRRFGLANIPTQKKNTFFNFKSTF